MIDYDYHTHSIYSDGRFLRQMLKAASEAGLSGIGISDHCNVSERDAMVETRSNLGFNLDVTYDRRRSAIERFREQFDIEIYDAVEMDYDPRDEDAIGEFLDEAGFQYAIGSVHHLEDVHVHYEPYFADKSEPERAALVDTYFEKLVALIDSELFDIVAHLDLFERNSVLRGFATETHYRQVAEALERSKTSAELNAGRVFDDFGHYHPTPPFLQVLREYDVSFTVGTDSHAPGELTKRVPHVADFFGELGIEPARLSV
ncbi:PHP domain-containing protein [Haloferax larsenii]|uniref:histidinol-phosphatase n=1 Tax=Haloferax larsenii TaxID=302484 RepID=A0A1H7PCW1_HALLR|nr:PHP domain-containing protein [Haloferax larsenii]SEL33593.1 histidinol-phosphatase (PHP family) [Haloferax larsenii]